MRINFSESEEFIVFANIASVFSGEGILYPWIPTESTWSSLQAAFGTPVFLPVF